MSIKLTTPFLVEVNGATMENDTDGAATLTSIDFQGNSVRFDLRMGTIEDAALNAGALAPTISVTVNLTTGEWDSTGADVPAGLKQAQHGTLAANDLVAFEAQINNLRNALEGLAISSGVMPGEQVPW